MNLIFDTDESVFRDEVRQFLAERLPAGLATKVAGGLHPSKEELEEWHAILHRQGWLAAGWPQAYGGPGWDPVRKYIFDLECGIANAPRLVPFGISMLGPVLLQYGTDEQKNHWLPRILDGSDWWCQGYSEPGAGSDLADLKTTALRDGDHYVVNGQKTWTTWAQHANMIFALVRTDTSAKKQMGISFLLIDMSSPGIEVRPIITLDGAHEINEVFFTDVRVPVKNLVGEENRGWECAKYLLTHERTGVAGIGTAGQALARLRTIASQRVRGGKPLAEDAMFAARLARIEIDLANMRTTNVKAVSAAAAGGAPGPESSLLKLRGTVVRQELSALTRRAMGPRVRAYDAELLDRRSLEDVQLPDPEAFTSMAGYLNNRKLSIYGGSNEIQRNIIAKTILGL